MCSSSGIFQFIGWNTKSHETQPGRVSSGRHTATTFPVPYLCAWQGLCRWSPSLAVPIPCGTPARTGRDNTVSRSACPASSGRPYTRTSISDTAAWNTDPQPRQDRAAIRRGCGINRPSFDSWLHHLLAWQPTLPTQPPFLLLLNGGHDEMRLNECSHMAGVSA